MSSNRASFLDLPLELREEIFSYAFLSTSTRQHRQYPTERNSEIKLHLDALADIIKLCSNIFLLSKAVRADALSWIYARVTVLIDLSDVETRGKLSNWLKAFRENEAIFPKNFEVLSLIPVMEELSSIPVMEGFLPPSAPCTIAVSLERMAAVAVRPFDPIYWSVVNAEKWAADSAFTAYREKSLVDVDTKLGKVMDDVRISKASGRLTGEHVKLIVDACFVASMEPNRKSTLKYDWIGAERKVYVKRIWDPEAWKEDDEETGRKGFLSWEHNERTKRLRHFLIKSPR
jgi:hypothetical protein